MFAPTSIGSHAAESGIRLLPSWLLANPVIATAMDPGQDEQQQPPGTVEATTFLLPMIASRRQLSTKLL
ncbi:hypothetical protein CSOJ01_04046 [Colletotrichum sojae]|uniref:Uncharacterized protein n=1 Tax=Colletotrichum sojae TaxID=2175907 RepID=A0A8H6JK59_9PEZI|nr:hypothetical protein CSOJ01_04046 [Colletotrichum sojae]